MKQTRTLQGAELGSGSSQFDVASDAPGGALMVFATTTLSHIIHNRKPVSPSVFRTTGEHPYQLLADVAEFAQIRHMKSVFW